MLAAEEDQRRLAGYREAGRQRDLLAAELKRVYPRMAKELTDLLARIAANDRTIENINAHALPSDRGSLLSAELVARGLESFLLTDGRTTMTRIPKITAETRLPAFKFDQFEGYSWPPNPNRNIIYKIYGKT